MKIGTENFWFGLSETTRAGTSMFSLPQLSLTAVDRLGKTPDSQPSFFICSKSLSLLINLIISLGVWESALKMLPGKPGAGSWQILPWEVYSDQAQCSAKLVILFVILRMMPRQLGLFPCMYICPSSLKTPGNFSRHRTSGTMHQSTPVAEELKKLLPFFLTMETNSSHEMTSRMTDLKYFLN